MKKGYKIIYRKAGDFMVSAKEEMTNFTFKMDKQTRDAYSELCSTFGLSMSAATLALIRQAVRSKSMSFSISDENGSSPAEVKELKCRITDVEEENVIRQSLKEEKKKKRKLGALKGKLIYMADDFDETPDCFKEYM